MRIENLEFYILHSTFYILHSRFCILTDNLPFGNAKGEQPANLQPANLQPTNLQPTNLQQYDQPYRPGRKTLPVVG
ncbi:MAG: hypothetical protein F6K37_21655 [Moorea sp. SIO4E2]|uniref:Uncharacterized protein n=1 Tax=Moorena producens 3L TaxID=489825 RepID=F4Y1Z4_9CYAN|nr:hypothetical protein [Moorena sp. SIO4E2]EGJ29286.1 hypothetical protein LYNGBM3L_65120 [Moorena producens 3L]NEQ08454.1 hypothetical protein [Moorena sp. SIO4E2]